MDIEKILSDEPEDEEVVVEPEAEAEPEIVEEAPPEAAPEGVEESAPPAPVTDKLPPEEFKGLKEERQKRQEAERRLAEAEARLNAVPPPEIPSVWEDEQGFAQHLGAQVVTQAVQQASFNAALNTSEMLARQANPDFEEVKAEFLRLAAENPALGQQALADPHPWNKAYQIAKTHRTMTELGATDLDTLKAKIREEIAAEMAEQAPAAKPAIPPTLSTQRNITGSRTGPAWTGPKPLEELLG